MIGAIFGTVAAACLAVSITLMVPITDNFIAILLGFGMGSMGALIGMIFDAS